MAVAEYITEIIGKRQDCFLDFVILFIFCQTVDIIQAVDIKMRPDLEVEILQLRLLQVQLPLVGFFFQPVDALERVIQRVAKVLRFGDFLILRHKQGIVTVGNLIHITGKDGQRIKQLLVKRHPQKGG